MLFAIERFKLCSFGLCAHYYPFAFHHVGIKAMHRLSIRHHDVVRNVYNVVDRSQSDDPQLILQPFWTIFHLTIRQRNTGIAFTGLCIFYLYINGQILVINLKGITIRAMQVSGITILFQPRIQVTCHAIMRKCIGTVCRDINFYHPIAF